MKNAKTKLKHLLSNIKRILNITNNETPTLNCKQIVAKIKNLPTDKQIEARRLFAKKYGFTP